MRSQNCAVAAPPSQKGVPVRVVLRLPTPHAARILLGVRFATPNVDSIRVALGRLMGRRYPATIACGIRGRDKAALAKEDMGDNQAVRFVRSGILTFPGIGEVLPWQSTSSPNCPLSAPGVDNVCRSGQGVAGTVPCSRAVKSIVLFTNSQTSGTELLASSPITYTKSSSSDAWTRRS
jgi:hypothetical protein